jgi:hypothetical protein
VFEERELRIFGPDCEEMVKVYRKLRNKELKNVYPAQTIISVMQIWDGQDMKNKQGMRNAYTVCQKTSREPTTF